MDSPQLQLIKNAFRVFEEEGMEAGVEGLLSISHPECEYRPYSATGKVLRGAEETRAFFLEDGTRGRWLRVRPQRFQEDGGRVIVSGSVRVHHESGGFSETQVHWIYRFRDGLLEEASWEPRYGSDAGVLPAQTSPNSQRTRLEPPALAEYG
jgi:ketosteroid isomerase-like protein